MVKNLPVNARDIGDAGSIPGLRTSRGGHGNSLVFLPGESHRQRSLVGYTVHGVAKAQTWLSTHAQRYPERGM